MSWDEAVAEAKRLGWTDQQIGEVTVMLAQLIATNRIREEDCPKRLLGPEKYIAWCERRALWPPVSEWVAEGEARALCAV